jgi:N-acetylmuramoyl-L-alanine amidase
MRPRLPAGPEAPAAMRAALAAFLLATVVLSAGAAELRVTRIGAVDYVSLEAAAQSLGLRVERLVPDTDVMLKSGAQPVARLSDHSRQVDIRGLRVFLGDPVVAQGGAFFVSRTDYQDRLVPKFRPELCGEAPPVPHVIAIDPGHGGIDPGAVNAVLGIMEKTYTLDVSLRLKRLLEAAGYRVVLTRDSDHDVPKPIRSEMANLAGADFLVSVHFNLIHNDRKTTGVEVMSFPPRSQRSTESWSPGYRDDAESKASPVNAFDAWSAVLGGALHRSLLDALRDGDRGEKLEHLAVLRGLKCPGVLVEPAFISSDVEGARLETAGYRDRIAAAIFSGIQEYCAEIRGLHPPQVQAPPAQPAAPGANAPRSEPTRPSPGP